MNDNKSLADRCFDYQDANNEVFEALQIICGGQSIENCRNDDFKWHVVDCWFDSYDSSIEIVIPEYAPPLDREKANKILDMGFCKIYESQGENGKAWYKNYESLASSRKRSGNKQLLHKREQEIFDLKDLLGMVLIQCNIRQDTDLYCLINNALYPEKFDK